MNVFRFGDLRGKMRRQYFEVDLPVLDLDIVVRLRPLGGRCESGRHPRHHQENKCVDEVLSVFSFHGLQYRFHDLLRQSLERVEAVSVSTLGHTSAPFLSQVDAVFTNIDRVAAVGLNRRHEIKLAGI